MGDMGDDFRAHKEWRKQRRAEFGVECPACKDKFPRAHPTILLPQQKCKVCGYRDPRRQVAA